MTLEQLKDRIKTISLSHVDISDFDYGEDALIATTDKVKPYVFLELPYSINLLYRAGTNFKSVQFGLLVLLPSIHDDNVTTDHSSISNAEQIGDAIVNQIENTIPEFRVTQVNGISLREFSDDNLNGFRYDVTGLLNRICDVSSYFNS